MTWEPKTLSLLCPSRWRPEKAVNNLVEHWFKRAQDLTRVEVIFSLRFDDETLPEYEHNIEAQIRPQVKTRIVKANERAAPATNEAAAVSSGEVLITVFDDIEAPPAWDTEILRRLTNQPGKCLFVSDGFRSDNLQTITVMTRSTYQDWGYVFYPQYYGMYSDNDYHEHALAENRIVWALDLVFEHRHYLRTGAQPDRTYLIQNDPKAYALGRTILAQRRTCQFKQ